MGDVLGNSFEYTVLFEGMLHYDTRALKQQGRFLYEGR